MLYGRLKRRGSNLARIVFIAVFLATGVAKAQDIAIPDFAAYTNVKEKKKVFFNYMYPLVLEANLKILEERELLLQAEGGTPAVKSLCQKYSDDCTQIDKAKIEELLKKVDFVPPSLALAQAANESAWGTSRFATKANNYYGQWCFSEGCGLVPLRRPNGSIHEVQKFASPQRSVTSYVHNLNTGLAYADLRAVRATERANDGRFNGHELAAGLHRYSQRGQEYVKEIRSMISYNKLIADYDNKFWQDIKKSKTLDE